MPTATTTEEEKEEGDFLTAAAAPKEREEKDQKGALHVPQVEVGRYWRWHSTLQKKEEIQTAITRKQHPSPREADKKEKRRPVLLEEEELGAEDPHLCGEDGPQEERLGKEPHTGNMLG